MNETEIKQMIEQVGYTEFYRYYKEQEQLIKMLQEQLDNVIKICKHHLSYLTNNKFMESCVEEILKELEK